LSNQPKLIAQRPREFCREIAKVLRIPTQGFAHLQALLEASALAIAQSAPLRNASAGRPRDAPVLAN
jgi:hypothetical protein